MQHYTESWIAITTPNSHYKTNYVGLVQWLTFYHLLCWNFAYILGLYIIFGIVVVLTRWVSVYYIRYKISQFCLCFLVSVFILSKFPFFTVTLLLLVVGVLGPEPNTTSDRVSLSYKYQPNRTELRWFSSSVLPKSIQALNNIFIILPTIFRPLFLLNFSCHFLPQFYMPNLKIATVKGKEGF